MDCLPLELIQQIMQHLSATDLLRFCLAFPAAVGLSVDRLHFGLDCSLMPLEQLQQLLGLVAWENRIRFLELLHRPDVTQWRLLCCLLHRPLPSLAVLHLACLELEPGIDRLSWLLARVPNIKRLRIRLKSLSEWLDCWPSVQLLELTHLQLHLSSLSSRPSAHNSQQLIGVQTPNLEFLELHMIAYNQPWAIHPGCMSLGPTHSGMILRLLFGKEAIRKQFRIFEHGLRYLAVTPAPPSENLEALLRLANQQPGLSFHHRLLKAEYCANESSALLLYRDNISTVSSDDSSRIICDPFTGTVATSLDSVIQSTDLNHECDRQLAKADTVVLLLESIQSTNAEPLQQQRRPLFLTDWPHRLRDLTVGLADLAKLAETGLRLPGLRRLQLHSSEPACPKDPLDLSALVPNLRHLLFDIDIGALHPRQCVKRLPDGIQSMRLSLDSLIHLRPINWLVPSSSVADKASELRVLSIACRFVGASDLRLLSDLALRLSSSLASLTLSANACDLTAVEIRRWLLSNDKMPAGLKLLCLDVPAAQAAQRVPRGRRGGGGRGRGTVRLRPHQTDDCCGWFRSVASSGSVAAEPSGRIVWQRLAGHRVSAFRSRDFCS